MAHDRGDASHVLSGISGQVAPGHSNGGILAYRLACELSDRIAAIGVQSSALEVSPCEPSTPVSVLHIHGADDQNLPIGGGQGPKAISGVGFSPPREGMETLATADGCPADPTRATDPDNPDLASRRGRRATTGPPTPCASSRGLTPDARGSPTPPRRPSPGTLRPRFRGEG